MASLVTHGALIVAVLLLTRRSADSAAQSGTPVAPFQPVEMIYLTPRSTLQVTQPISRPAPDAVQAKDDQRALIRQPLPDAAPTVEPDAAQPPAPEPPPDEPPPENSLATAPTPEPEQPTMESEAQRIFGRPQLRRQEDNSNTLGIRLGAISDREEAARRSCVPKPRDPHGQIEMAELVGRVWYDEAHTRPISGAFLQIIGTSYSAYSDGTGRYRLVFDASLVDECRTQYVRVVAAGYTGKNLVLGLGPGVNDVVMGR